MPAGDRVDLTLKDHTPIAGLYLAPSASHGSAPGLLWFYGNGENVAGIWPVVRAFRPPDVAALVVDYPGYGASGGKASEARLYEAAQAAYDALIAKPEVDPSRIVIYGRSLGSAVATWLAARRPVAGVVLESPFTNAREMARQQYRIFPSFVLRLKLDNLTNVAAIDAPLLVFHGTRDQLVSPSMGRRVADAARGRAEYVPIEGAGHNTTYDVGGEAYRDGFRAFVRKVTAPKVKSP